MALSASDKHEIGLYYETGVQDCGNSFDIGDDELEQGGTAKEIADSLELMSFEDWRDQFEDVWDHIAQECYEAWIDGYRACAVHHIERRLQQRRDAHELYYLATRYNEPDETIVETFEYDDFNDALNAMVRLRDALAVIYYGDANGPHEAVALIGMDGRPAPGPDAGVVDRDRIAAWREGISHHAYVQRSFGKPVKGNPIDDGQVFWLVIGKASTIDVRQKIASGDLEVVEKFDYFEDALNELAKTPQDLRPRILVGNAKSPSDNVVASRAMVDGRVFPAFSFVYRDQVDAWKEKYGINQSPVIARSTPPWSKAVKKNPTEDTKRAAVGKYKEFWRQEPTKVGEFPASFKIPARVHKLGRAVNVLYESKKTDPETLKKPGKPLAYIHEHDAGVHIHDLHGELDTEVPDFIKHAQALVCLGQCLGFAWWDEEGDEHEAEGTDPLPDLWCTVDGRALLVIQSRRTVLQIVWGGGLGVEARGIVG